MPLRLRMSEFRSAMGCSVSKWAYIVVAFTPASVRPAPVMGVSWRSTIASAFSMVSCTLTSRG